MTRSAARSLCDSWASRSIFLCHQINSTYLIWLIDGDVDGDGDDDDDDDTPASRKRFSVVVVAAVVVYFMDRNET